MKEYGDDIDAIRNWAMDVDLRSHRNNPVAKGLRGIGFSAIQYLRMQARVDTAKPDNRVKEALSELGIKYEGDLEVVRICENLARKLGIRPEEFDFILWYSREEACA